MQPLLIEDDTDLRSVRMCDASHAARVFCDDGPGISDELRKRLFQPFSAGQNLGGNGLGLAICLEITHTLDKQIKLVSLCAHGQVTGLDTRHCSVCGKSIN